MIRSLLAILAEDRRPLRRMLVGLVAAAVLEGVGFVLALPILDHLVARDRRAAGRWLVVLVAVLAMSAVIHYLTQIAGYRTAIASGRRLFHRLGDHLAELPLGWFDEERIGPVGRLASNGVLDVMSMPAHLLRPLVNALVVPLTVAVLTLVVDWRLAIALVAMAPLMLVAYRRSARLMERSDRDTATTAVAVANRLAEYGRAQPELRAFDQLGAGAALLDTALVTHHRATRRQVGQVLIGMVGFAVTVQAVFTVLLLAGIAIATRAGLDVARAAVLFTLLVRCVEPLQRAGELGGALRIAHNSVARIDELLATPTMPEADDPNTPGEPAVRFDDVSFGYGDGEPVIEHVSFTIPPRTMTALVGPSGAGKTTIARLIGRFWDVDGGSVAVGGVDVRRLSTEDLVALVSFVFQDVYLFDDTIAANILLARPDAAPGELERAMRLSRVDEIVARLPNGLETRVGEGGARLSGGERQRVSIARALLGDAPIVVFDEATAALDSENEALLHDALLALRAERTVLVIAHRMATITAADQIVFLDHGGRVAEIGDHAELLAADGPYRASWERRATSQGWRLGAGGC